MQAGWPGLKVGGQRVLEVGGLEVLTISEEDWSTLQHRLAFPLLVVSVRRVEEDTQTGPNKTLK